MEKSKVETLLLRALHCVFSKDALKALLIYLVFLAIRIEYHIVIPEINSSFIFILSILVITLYTKGYFWGMFYAVVGMFIANFFLYEPRFTFYFLSVEYIFFFCGVFAVAMTVCFMTGRTKKIMEEMRLEERKKDCLYQFSKGLLMVNSISELVDLTLEHFSQYSETSVVFHYLENDVYKTAFHCMEPMDEELLYDKTEQMAMGYCIREKCAAGFRTGIFSNAKGFYIPVSLQSGVVGTIGVLFVNKNKSNRVNLTPLLAMTIQISMAFEKRKFFEEQQYVLLETEKEKIRSNLLRAISHDLRTPLTGILGSSTILRESHEQIQMEKREQLLAGIQKDARWLIQMVENILSVTKINADGGNIQKKEEVVEEIVAESVARVKRHYPDADIVVVAPEDVLMVPMDATLIEQVIINLIENAVKHSQQTAKVEISFFRRNDYICFDVCDNGFGFQEDEIPLLFKSQLGKTKSKRMDSTRGMGIGLSICMSVIKAHDGDMYAYNLPEGGACVGFILPFDETEE